MAGGVPRTVSFPPDQMIELGKEMVEWVKVHDPLHLSEWYTIEKMFTYKEWKSFIQKEEFIPYYEQALKLVGRKYIDKNSNVRDGISQRWQRVYFADLKEEEDDTKRFESSLKKEENREVSQDLVDRHDAFNRQVDALRKERDKLKNGT